MKNTQTKINSFNLLHWLVTICLVIAVTVMGLMLRMAYIEIQVAKELTGIAGVGVANAMECINNSDTDCNGDKYQSAQEYRDRINELHKQTPQTPN